VSSVATLVDFVQEPEGHCEFAVHCTHTPALALFTSVSHQGVAPAHPSPLSAHEHARQPAGIFGAPEHSAGTFWLSTTHALRTLLQTC
jgi:hypothetical protein